MLRKLDANHFVKSGPDLRLTIKEKSVVLFKTATCQKCEAFFPIFKTSAERHLDTRHFIVCIDEAGGSKLVAMSNGTKTPIMTVPTIIFYHAGAAKTKFSGTLNPNSFSEFLMQMSEMLRPVHQSNNFVNTFPRQPAVSEYGRLPQNQAYQPLGTDEDEKNALSLPQDITPWNTPWDSTYKKIEG